VMASYEVNSVLNSSNPAALPAGVALATGVGVAAAVAVGVPTVFSSGSTVALGSGETPVWLAACFGCPV